MFKHKKLMIILGLLFFLFVRFYCGVFEDDEFGNDVYFIKHRPVWKWRFFSPRGMSVLYLEQMTSEQKIEQIYFDEFVLNKK